MNDNNTGLSLPLSKTQQKKLAAQAHNEAMRATAIEPYTISPEQRVELEALSLEVFGATSRYATLLRDGEVKVVTTIVTEYIPAEGSGSEGTTKEVEVVETFPGHPKSAKLHLVRHTVESVKTLMLDRKAKQDVFRAAMAKLEADKKEATEQAKLKQAVQNNLGGSAI